MTWRSEKFQDTALPHIDAVYRAAFALSRKKDTADDLTQTTFLKALKSFHKFKQGTNARAWLMTILRNTWFDQLRHRKIAGPTASIDEMDIPEKTYVPETQWSNAADMLENFSNEQVINALGELGDDQRLTLYLVDVEGLSQREVAQITGVAEGTVKSRASRARNEMKIKLQAYAKDVGLAGDKR